MNLANHPGLKPSKLVLTINNLLADPLIHQTFFAKCSQRVNSPNFPTILYMILATMVKYHCHGDRYIP